MHAYLDPDEWKAVSEHRVCTACNGDMRKCNGACNGMSSFGMVRRDPAEVAKIKADRAAERERDILLQAAAILAQRSRK